MTSRPLLVFAAVALTLGASASAHAETLLGVELGMALDDTLPAETSGPGTSVDIILGYQAPIPVVRIIPELQLGYSDFPAAPDAPEQAIYTGRIGGRVGLGGLIGPSVFGHAGYGTLDSSDQVALDGFTYDAGFALDTTILPLVNLGAHASLNGIQDRDADAMRRWYEIGLHGEVVF